METDKPIDAMAKIVEILTPLSSEERTRVVQAAMVLLGRIRPRVGSAVGMKESPDEQPEWIVQLPLRARAWMKQNGITPDELQQIFHLADGGVEVIAPHMPGKSKKEQTYSAYILTGIGQLLVTGIPFFQDKVARALCENSGCYDSANHSVHLKNRGNEFTGSKDKGWTLTAPGLNGAGSS